MAPQPLFAVDFAQVANAGRRTKHRATFPLAYLDKATDENLHTCAFVRQHCRHHHDQDNLPLYNREVRHWLKSVRFTVEPHINLGGVEVAVGIRADLLDLLQLPGKSCEFQLMKNDFLPEYFDFQFGTCAGSLRPGPTAYELLVVVNNVPGNGDFGRLLLHLELLAAAYQRDMLVLEILSSYLYQHLRKRDYQPVADTTHLLRRIAGPGTVPQELVCQTPFPELEELLTRYLNIVVPAGPTHVKPRNKREAA